MILQVEKEYKHILIMNLLQPRIGKVFSKRKKQIWSNPTYMTVHGLSNLKRKTWHDIH